MNVLSKLTKEYLWDNIREEDEIDISDLDVDIIQFKDNNGCFHGHGYRVKDGDEDKMTTTLSKLIGRIIEKRGNECDLNDIDVSNIKKMNSDSLFHNYTIGIFENSDFNGDISGWDVSGVTDMSYMFFKAKKFNKPIGKWDVSGVEKMKYMFKFAEDFNQPLDKWDVSNVWNMDDMFRYAKSFNQDISGWNMQTTNFYEKDYYGEMFEGCPIIDKHKPKHK